MKVLVSTKTSLGRETGYPLDFNYVPEGEVVMPLFAWELLGTAGPGESCALGGTQTHRATTIFKVVERKITLEKLQERIFKALSRQGFIEEKSNSWCSVDQETGRKVAWGFARAVSRAAERFPEEDILEKHRVTFQSRKNPSRKTRVIVRF